MAQLRTDYENSRLLWSRLYKKLDMFKQAYHDAECRIDNESQESPMNPEPSEPSGPELTEAVERNIETYKTPLLNRDNNECRCCGRELGKGVRLEIDHIVPVKMGGQTILDNLQMLCRTCNMEKGTQLISFLNNKTQIEKHMNFKLIRPNPSETIDCSVTRVINFFYRTNAVCNILYSQRSSGKNYSNWIIQIHEGNPISWLIPHKKELLEYIHNELGWTNVQDLEIVTV